MIRRGEVHWHDLGDPVGSRPAHRRPVVVVQSDALNDSAWRTVVVVTLTSTLARANSPDHVLIPSVASGLPRDSVAVASHLAVINKDELRAEESLGILPDYLMKDLDAAIRVALDL